MTSLHHLLPPWNIWRERERDEESLEDVHEDTGPDGYCPRLCLCHPPAVRLTTDTNGQADGADVDSAHRGLCLRVLFPMNVALGGARKKEYDVPL